jgi:hypothetical protein
VSNGLSRQARRTHLLSARLLDPRPGHFQGHQTGRGKPAPPGSRGSLYDAGVQSLYAPRVMLLLAAVLCCSIGVGGLVLLALWRTRLAPRVGRDGGEQRPGPPQ